MGVRGSPRRLGLPNEDLPKVAYNLEDPSAFKGQEIAIVGGGNAAVEAAQYLAKRELGNKVRLLVRGKVLDRCNDENKARLNELVDAGLVKLQFESSISSIEKATVKIKTSDHEESVKNTALFVFAGADVPFKFLMGLGIKIDKKFGEAAGSKP
jgi:thioredoxin reductase (NADPH)